jgi:hypothetical protein
MPASEQLPASVDPPQYTITVTVEYRLKEYLRTLQDFVQFDQHRQAVAKGKQRSGTPKSLNWFVKWPLILLGSMAFFYKVSKVGTCRFRINATSIERSSKLGTLIVEWSEVVSVLRLSETYLIQLSKGGMPIPFRCMDRPVAAAFERLASGKLVSTVFGGA